MYLLFYETCIIQVSRGLHRALATEGEGATRFRPVAAELVGPFDVGASGGGIVGAGFAGPKDVGLLAGGGRMVGGAGGAGGGTDCPAHRISVGVADEDTAREAAAGPRSCEQR